MLNKTPTLKFLTNPDTWLAGLTMINTQTDIINFQESKRGGLSFWGKKHILKFFKASKGILKMEILSILFSCASDTHLCMNGTLAS